VNGAAGDVVTLEEHLARLDAHEPGDGAQQGGLSRAVRTQERQDLAAPHVERCAAHDGQPGFVSRDEILDDERGAGH
jgi:hypothetical protein